MEQYSSMRDYRTEQNHHTCSCTLHIHIDHAGLHSGLRQQGLHLASEIAAAGADGD
jgi:hypothetical protein